MFMAGMNVDTMPYFDFYRSMMKYCWQIGRKIVNLLFQFLIIGIENESFMSKEFVAIVSFNSKLTNTHLVMIIKHVITINKIDQKVATFCSRLL